MHAEGRGHQLASVAPVQALSGVLHRGRQERAVRFDTRRLCSVGSGSMAHVCCRHRTDCTVQVFGYSASSSSSSSTAA